MSDTQRARWCTASGTASVSDARHFVRTTLVDWGWRTALADAEIVATELVTNACEHAAGDVEVRLGLDNEQLRIEVLDNKPDAPPIIRYDHHHRGYGLHIVEAIAITWGFETVATRKSVWALLDLAHPVIVATDQTEETVTLTPSPVTRHRRAR
jgi:anti-sigma regulatory factor (Ser/Thr protein kinase)